MVFGDKNTFLLVTYYNTAFLKKGPSILEGHQPFRQVDGAKEARRPRRNLFLFMLSFVILIGVITSAFWAGECLFCILCAIRG